MHGSFMTCHAMTAHLGVRERRAAARKEALGGGAEQ